MIERIKIAGFKSIRELDLSLRSINILVGPNGVGKSNFISFFKLLNQLVEQKLRSYVAESGYMNNLLFFGAKHTDSLDGFVDFDNTNAYSFQLKPTATSEAVLEYENDWYNGYGDKQKDYDKWHVHNWTTAGRESSLLDKSTSRANHLKRFMRSFKVYHFHDTSAKAPLRSPGRVVDVERLYEDGRNLAAFLYFLQEHHPASFQQIEKAVRAVAPFFQRFNLNPSPGNAEYIQLVWKSATDNGEQNFFAAQLSDGTLRFVALATLLLQPAPPPIILIDEPELGLHPVAIARLAALMQKVAGRSQLIISTQSVELVDQFEPADIIVVEMESPTWGEPDVAPSLPRQSVFRRLDGVALARWLENYTLGDLWKKNVLGGRP